MNISGSGALRQERRFQLISQNLSNVQTAGYKKDVPVFSTLFAGRLDFFENQKSEGSAISFQQGSIEKTGNPLDLAIDGEGFFKVMTPNGVRYTRAGHFKLDREQRLTNANGFPVLGRNGEIKLNGKEIVAERDGTIKVDGAEANKIALVTFNDLTRLNKEGNNLLRSATSDGEREVDSASVFQGYLEQSNVNSIEEMVRLIDAIRTYESCLKMLQSRDELNGKVVNELGRV
jgi:flagellar basal-body rod protein FlgG